MYKTPAARVTIKDCKPEYGLAGTKAHFLARCFRKDLGLPLQNKQSFRNLHMAGPSPEMPKPKTEEPRHENLLKNPQIIDFLGFLSK